MWNMQEFGIQFEWTITVTRTLLTTRSTRSTRSTTRNPTMCAATYSTWWTCEHARSLAVFVVRLCFAVVTLILCTSHFGSRCLRMRLVPSHGHHHDACMSWAFSLTSLTFSSTSLLFSSFSLSSSTSSCPSSSLMLSSKYPCALSPRRWGLMTRTSPSQVMSPRTTSSQRLTSSSIRSPWPSNGFPEDMAYDDAAIGQMLFNAHRGQVNHYTVVVVNISR